MHKRTKRNIIQIINFNDLEELKFIGFRGFKSISELWEDKSEIPKKKGVYIILNPSYENTGFINPGSGGFFKGKDPNVSIDELKSKFLENSKVVYIGKAGSLNGNATLNSRIGQYLRFGQSKKAGHTGGRFIWQMKNHSELIFCWKIIEDNDPRLEEKKLLELFEKQFGRKPFANLSS